MNNQEENKDLISVIIPAYKIEQYIGDCLESVQNQTYRNLEILVVNDGSPDNSAKIAEQYAEKDDRIRVINKVNGGLSDARNTGIEQAKGKYIILIDGDDYVDVHMIEKMYQAMLISGSDLCLCGIHIVDDNRKPLEDAISQAAIQGGVYTRAQMYEKIITTPNWFYVVAWNKLYKREVFDKIKYPKGKLHEDEFVIHHILECSEKIICIEDKLYHYVQRGQSITHDTFNIKRMDVVEAFVDRADFFLNKQNPGGACRMLKRIRISLIDGYLALKKNGNAEDKKRIRELHQGYRKVYRRIPKGCISVKEKILLGMLNVSLKLGVLCSGNYWHTLKYR